MLHHNILSNEPSSNYDVNLTWPDYPAVKSQQNPVMSQPVLYMTGVWKHDHQHMLHVVECFGLRGGYGLLKFPLA
jgi:hypothetical protein